MEGNRTPIPRRQTLLAYAADETWDKLPESSRLEVMALIIRTLTTAIQHESQERRTQHERKDSK